MTKQEEYLILLRAFIITATEEHQALILQDPDFIPWVVEATPNILGTIERLAKKGLWG